MNLDAPKIFGALLLAAFGLATTLCVGACRGPREETTEPSTEGASSPLDERLSRYGAVTLTVDATGLPERRQRLIKKLIEAARYIDRVYWEQSYPSAWEMRQGLQEATDPESRKLLRLLEANAGPFDRVKDGEPFYGSVAERPRSAGFYPEDLTREELEAYVESHPEVRDALLSPYTVVRRRAGDRLEAVPFHEHYGEWIRPAAVLLSEAAALAEDPALARFLESRGEALLSDEYEESDRLWLGVIDSWVVLIVGPRSTGLDGLMGVKRAYEMTAGLVERDETRRLQTCLDNLAELEAHLPMDAAYKRLAIKPRYSSVVVVNDFVRAGRILRSQTGAMDWPEDSKVREESGFSKVFFKNVQGSRVETIILPRIRHLLSKEQLKHVTAQGYFHGLTLHYLAHQIGPQTVKTAEGGESLKDRMGKTHGPLDEAKADLAALDGLAWLGEQGDMPAELVAEHYLSFLAQNFKTLHDRAVGDAPESHGRAAHLVVNWSREQDALTFDETSERWYVDLERIVPALRLLLAEILKIQATGDRERAVALLARYETLDPRMESALDIVASRVTSLDLTFVVKWE